MTSLGSKERAQETKDTAKQATAEVAQTAADKAKEVAGEAQRQARNLVGETRENLTGHVQQQHQNLVDQLRSLANEFSSLANGQSTGEGGVATELVSQAGDRAQQAVSWLENRQPADLVEEVRRFAQQRPGAFLAGAAIVGVLAGRLTRGAVAAHRDSSDTSIDYAKSSANNPSYSGGWHPSPTPNPTPSPSTEWAAGYQPTQAPAPAPAYSTPPAGQGVPPYVGDER